MDLWQSIYKLIQLYRDELTLVVILGVAFFIFYIVRGMMQQRRERQAELAERRSPEALAALRQAQQHKKTQDEQIREDEQRLAAIREKAEKIRAQRAAAEKKAAERFSKQQGEMDRAIAEWSNRIQSEQEEIKVEGMAAAKAAAAEIDSKIEEIDRSLLEWEIETLTEEELRPAVQLPSIWTREKASDDKIRTVKEQVNLVSKSMEKEVEDLEYLINKIQTGVDFLPIQVQETINKWKDGEVYRRSTLDDLKLKFRYQAYSIDDGLELLYMYTDWIAKQRQRLRKFINVLGTETETEESIPAAVQRAEKEEWSKNLEMNMDVIGSLKEIRNIYQTTVNMEHRLKDLEKVCKKRSEQIISPRWEPKGSL